jgi:hypothetical protein
VASSEVVVSVDQLKPHTGSGPVVPASPPARLSLVLTTLKDFCYTSIEVRIPLIKLLIANPPIWGIKKKHLTRLKNLQICVHQTGSAQEFQRNSGWQKFCEKK